MTKKHGPAGGWDNGRGEANHGLYRGAAVQHAPAAHPAGGNGNHGGHGRGEAPENPPHTDVEAHFELSPIEPPGKERITIWVDRDVLRLFGRHEDEPQSSAKRTGYQTKINRALRRYIHQNMREFFREGP